MAFLLYQNGDNMNKFKAYIKEIVDDDTRCVSKLFNKQYDERLTVDDTDVESLVEVELTNEYSSSQC